MTSWGVILLGVVSIKISIGNVQQPSISTWGGVLVKIGGGARIGLFFDLDFEEANIL